MACPGVVRTPKNKSRTNCFRTYAFSGIFSSLRLVVLLCQAKVWNLKNTVWKTPFGTVWSAKNHTQKTGFKRTRFRALRNIVPMFLSYFGLEAREPLSGAGVRDPKTSCSSAGRCMHCAPMMWPISVSGQCPYFGPNLP